MWLHHLWFGYFVPSLWGNGPEAVVQTVVYGGAAYLIVPRFRRFVNAHMRGIHLKLNRQHEELMAQAERHHAERMAQAERHQRNLHEHLKNIGIKEGPRRDANGRFVK